MSSPSPLGDAEPLVCIPKEAKLDITSFASMEMITFRNTLTGKLKCCYQMWLISMTSLWLNPSEAWDQPGADQEITTSELSEYALKEPTAEL